MLNQVVLVGRLTSDPKVEEKGDKKVTNVTIAIPRSFKNIDGTYDTDFIKCTLYDNIATNTSEYCKKGDIVGIKGRLQNFDSEDTNVIAEKVTFLSSKSE
ncbi:MAG: single-stranded DNA-binding protein [Methanosphaera sp.]|nr:single-stranded DNA-binding protein [Methanobrevibacter sp.]MBQ6754197.1 single-stranded DNA-binding protein [Bacteroidales bacterium]MBR0351361.1 single-stranded DNA-binding protein [Clostridia bacterium]MBR0473245.1 single-stranded DNA-binding protein [Methanosphaera sp.]